MIVRLEAVVPQQPADLRRAALRSLDEWRAQAATCVELVGSGESSARAEAVLRVAEPEAVVHPRALSSALEALSGAPEIGVVVPGGFYAGTPGPPTGCAAVWELEALEGCPGMREASATGLSPFSLVRSGEGRRVAASACLVYSFASRRGYARPEVARLVPASARSVLEVGCAEGALGAALEASGARVTGIEPDGGAAAVAARRLSHVLVAPVEDALQTLSGRFDAIVAADVLEHLSEPVSVLLALRERLSPGGVLVVSLPNASHASVLGGLLQGRWDPALEGIVADGHLTYAGRAGWTRLLLAAGFEVERWEPVPVPTPAVDTWGAVLAGTVPAEHLTAGQWLGVARAGSPLGAVELGRADLDCEVDLVDPVGSVRSHLESGSLEATLPNATAGPLLETLLAGDVVAGAGRAALVAAFTPRALKRRFAGSPVKLSVSSIETVSLSPALNRLLTAADRRGLPVSREALSTASFRVRFQKAGA